MKIDKTISIEELINIFPPAISLLSNYRIRCLQCGEPSWGTLESAAKEKNISEEKLNEIINVLNIEFRKYNKE